MSIYVAFDGPMDQYFMGHPRALFDKPIEATHVTPRTPLLPLPFFAASYVKQKNVHLGNGH